MRWNKGDECRVHRPLRGTREGQWLDAVVVKVNEKTVWVRYKTTPLFDDETKSLKVKPEEIRPI